MVTTARVLCNHKLMNIINVFMRVKSNAIDLELEMTNCVGCSTFLASGMRRRLSTDTSLHVVKRVFIEVLSRIVPVNEGSYM